MVTKAVWDKNPYNGYQHFYTTWQFRTQHFRIDIFRLDIFRLDILYLSPKKLSEVRLIARKVQKHDQMQCKCTPIQSKFHRYVRITLTYLCMIWSTFWAWRHFDSRQNWVYIFWTSANLESTYLVSTFWFKKKLAFLMWCDLFRYLDLKWCCVKKEGCTICAVMRCSSCSKLLVWLPSFSPQALSWNKFGVKSYKTFFLSQLRKNFFSPFNFW